MYKIFCLFILSLFFGGCGQEEEKQQEKTPSLSIEHPEEKADLGPDIKLVPAQFKDLKNWYRDDLIKAFPAIKASCEQIIKEKNKYMSNAELKVPTEAYQHACKKMFNSDISTSAELRFFLDKVFKPYLVMDKSNPNGKFTAYFESALEASQTESLGYPYPIYGKPLDLIEVSLSDFDDKLPNQKIYGRIDAKQQKLVPYFTREQIETGKLAAPIILWAKDLVDLHIMQIQGSAVAKLENGDRVRIGFAAHNGHPFTGIGSILLSQGLIDKEHASMSEIRKWLKKHPQQAVKELRKNKRYVFHRIASTTAPVGAHNVPLTPQRSLAVDKQYIPLGSLLWLETTGPLKEPIEQLVVAQDIGGAIKGIVRGDFYWGSGDEEVLEQAGKMNSIGRYYILLPKTMEIVQ
ncbi:MAG: MltA domain-containing protein [Alphaproteobacteria bacterium]|nr:MltA domain-containing protein [Alphaproteobacteria bacterium]MBQ8677922.1 MltA domain-containing protein [Alphaproteobacteria bacterium]